MKRAKLLPNLYPRSLRKRIETHHTFESNKNVRIILSFRSVFECTEGINTRHASTRTLHFVYFDYLLDHANSTIYNGWKSKESESEKGEPEKGEPIETSQSEERRKERKEEECRKTTTDTKGNLWYIHLSSAQASPPRCWNFHQSDERHELFRQRPLRQVRLRSIQTCQEQDHVFA